MHFDQIFYIKVIFRIQRIILSIYTTNDIVSKENLEFKEHNAIIGTMKNQMHFV